MEQKIHDERESVSIEKKTLSFPVIIIISAGVFFFISFFRVYNFMNPNERSRFYLAHALAERGSFEIDAEINRFGDTVDKAKKDGVHYSDKAPLLAFVSVPIYKAYLLFNKGKVTEGNSLWFLKMMILAPLAVLLFWLLVAVFPASFSIRAKLFLAAAIIFGTPVSTYFSVYFAHSFAAVLLFAFFLAAARLDSHSSFQAFFTGLLGGLVFVAEYPTAVALVIIACWYLWRARFSKGSLFFIFGAIVVAGLFALYNTKVFGSPFSFGYSNLEAQGFAQVHEKGLYGITTPQIRAIKEFFFSFRIGLFTLSPFLLFLFPGIYYGFKKKNSMIIVSSFVFIAYFLTVASFGVWDGGWSLGARHLVPVIPFAGLLAVYGLDSLRHKIGVKEVFAFFASVAVILFTVGNALLPYASDNQANPFANYYPIAFLENCFPYRSLLSFAGYSGKVSFLIYCFSLFFFWLILLRGFLARWETRLIVVSCAILCTAFFLIPGKGKVVEEERTYKIFGDFHYPQTTVLKQSFFNGEYEKVLFYYNRPHKENK